MTLSELRKEFKSRSQGIPPEHELDDLLAEFLSLSRGQLELAGNRIITEFEYRELESHFLRLKAGEPLAYLLGFKHFYKYQFQVSPDVLIPRPETELLVELALEHIPLRGESQVVDLGAGSGCVGLSLARERPEARVYLFEASQKASLICEQNRVALGADNAQCIQRLIEEPELGTWPWSTPLDVVVANPPYIANRDPRVHWRVHQFEPHQALYAPGQGLHWIHKWVNWSYHHLKTGGWFCFEFGEDQENQILPLVSPHLWSEPVLNKDYSDITRFMSVQKRS